MTAGRPRTMSGLKQIVEAALPAGALAVPSAQIPFTIRDGRLRVGATTLDGNGVRATVSGGYDIAADQADIRAALSLTMTDRASGDSTARRGHARRAQPQRRRCAVVVMAGGAGDRSRNPKARCDRTRRAAAAGAAADRAARGWTSADSGGGAAERAGDQPKGGRDPRRPPREEGGGAAPADAPVVNAPAGARRQASRRSRRCRRRSTCGPRRAPPSRSRSRVHRWR